MVLIRDLREDPVADAAAVRPRDRGHRAWGWMSSPSPCSTRPTPSSRSSSLRTVDPEHDRHGRDVPEDRLPAEQGPVPRESCRRGRRHRQADLRRALGASRVRIRSRARSASGEQPGAPFVTADPGAGVRARTSWRSRDSCSAWRPSAGVRGARRREQVTDPRPIGVFAPSVGGLTVFRRPDHGRPASRRSTSATTRAPRTVPGRRRDPRLLHRVDRRAGRARRQGRRRGLQHLDRIRLGDLRRRYDLPILGVIRPGAASVSLATRNRRVGVIGTPATIRSHAYFAAIKDENPAVEVYEHARRRSCRWSRPPALRAGGRGERPGGAGAAPRRAGRVRRVRLPAAAVTKIDTLLLGARTTRCFDRRSPRSPATGSRSSIPRRRQPPRWPSCCRSTGWRRPRAAAHRTSSRRRATSRIRSIAERMFGDAFPDVVGAFSAV